MTNDGNKTLKFIFNIATHHQNGHQQPKRHPSAWPANNNTNI